MTKEEFVAEIESQKERGNKLLKQVLQMNVSMNNFGDGMAVFGTPRLYYTPKDELEPINIEYESWKSYVHDYLLSVLDKDDDFISEWDLCLQTPYRHDVSERDWYTKEINEALAKLDSFIQRIGFRLKEGAIKEETAHQLKSDSGKTPMVFISHRSSQVQFVTALVELLEKCGFTSDNLFCSSVPGFNIGLDEDIIETLRKKFIHYNLYVIYVFSTDFFKSAYCLNEMGAAWALQVKNSIIVTRDMDETKIDGVVSKTKARVSFKETDLQLKTRMIELRDKLLSFANLPKVADVNWTRYYEKFITDTNIFPALEDKEKNSKANVTNGVASSIDNPDNIVSNAVNRLGEFTMKELQEATGIHYRYLQQKIQNLVQEGTLEAIGNKVHRKYKLKI